MRAATLEHHRPMRDWQIALAAGFLALTCLGASIDRRHGVIDRSAIGSRPVERVTVVPTDPELVREMLTHD